MEVQRQIRKNAEALSEYVKDMKSWINEMDQIDEGLKRASKDVHDDQYPAIRSTTEISTSSKPTGGKVVTEEPTESEPAGKTEPAKKKKGWKKKPKKRIPMGDYDKWSKFNVDKALEEVDQDAEEVIAEPAPVAEKKPAEPVVRKSPQERSVEEKEKGNRLFGQKKYQEAILCYTRCYALDPSSAVPLGNRAACFIHLERWEDAVQDCTSALRIDESFVKAYVRRAHAQRELGQLDEALSDFARANELQPNNRRILEEIAQTQAAVDKKNAEKAKTNTKRKRIPISVTDDSVVHVKDGVRVSVPKDEVKAREAEEKLRQEKLEEEKEAARKKAEAKRAAEIRELERVEEEKVRSAYRRMEEEKKEMAKKELEWKKEKELEIEKAKKLEAEKAEKLEAEKRKEAAKKEAEEQRILTEAEQKQATQAKQVPEKEDAKRAALQAKVEAEMERRKKAPQETEEEKLMRLAEEANARMEAEEKAKAKAREEQKAELMRKRAEDRRKRRERQREKEEFERARAKYEAAAPIAGIKTPSPVAPPTQSLMSPSGSEFEIAWQRLRGDPVAFGEFMKDSGHAGLAKTLRLVLTSHMLVDICDAVYEGLIVKGFVIDAYNILHAVAQAERFTMAVFVPSSGREVVHRCLNGLCKESTESSQPSATEAEALAKLYRIKIVK